MASTSSGAVERASRTWEDFEPLPAVNAIHLELAAVGRQAQVGVELLGQRDQGDGVGNIETAALVELIVPAQGSRAALATRAGGSCVSS